MGFGNRSTGKGTYGDEFGERHCNQWGLTFAATRPSSEITWADLLYSVRNAHIFVRSPLKLTGKSITCTQVSQSIDNDLVD